MKWQVMRARPGHWLAFYEDLNFGQVFASWIEAYQFALARAVEWATLDKGI